MKKSAQILILLAACALSFASLGQDAAPLANDPAQDAARIAKYPKPLKPIRILVVGGHPADVFDQSGGTMAHHVERGDWVGCAVLTAGTRIHDTVVANQLKEQRQTGDAAEVTRTMAERANVKRKEVIKACSILGVKKEDIHFLEADDGVLLVNDSMIRKVARLIRKLRPDVIITHFPSEGGGFGAHAIAGQIVMNAISFAAGVDPEDENKPHNVTQVFFFGIGAANVRNGLWSSTGGFYNDVFVDISDVAAKKVACLDCMVSQGYNGPYAHKRIDSVDGAFGDQAHVPYAEGFITLRSSVQYYLPVSAIDLEHTKVSDRESIIRRSYRVNVPITDGSAGK